MIFFTPVTCHPCEPMPAAGECRVRVVLTHRMGLSATTDRPLQAMSSCWGLLTPTHGCERLLFTFNPSSACEALLYCVPWRWVSCFPQTFFHRVSYALHVRLITAPSNPARLPTSSRLPSVSCHPPTLLCYLRPTTRVGLFRNRTKGKSHTTLLPTCSQHQPTNRTNRPRPLSLLSLPTIHP